jgi:hypothetical protein
MMDTCWTRNKANHAAKPAEGTSATEVVFDISVANWEGARFEDFADTPRPPRIKIRTGADWRNLGVTRALRSWTSCLPDRC